MISLLSILSTIPTEPASPSSAVDFSFLFVKMLLVLVVVSVLAIITLKFIAPKLGLFKNFQKGSHFSVLGRYVLEPKKSLYLVNIGKKYLVIGTSDHGINLITEISEEEAKKE